MSTSSRLGSSRPTRAPSNDSVRRLLMAGSVAGPLYLGVGFAQALVRDGFDVTQHALSLLANGRFGWIQILNLVLTGALVVTAAQGVRRALELMDPHGRGTRSPGWLLTIYGASLIVAGVFTADPALGFPPGTPAGPTPISWHGLVHFAAGGVGFACFIAACLVLARRFHQQGMRLWAIFSAATGVIFLFAFLGISSGSRGPTTLAFVGAVTLSFVWLLALTRKLARAL